MQLAQINNGAASSVIARRRPDAIGVRLDPAAGSVRPKACLADSRNQEELTLFRASLRHAGAELLGVKFLSRPRSCVD